MEMKNLDSLGLNFWYVKLYKIYRNNAIKTEGVITIFENIILLKNLKDLKLNFTYFRFKRL